nr:thiamine pyrophosphate-binding protein [Streptomyces antimycoticus]
MRNLTVAQQMVDILRRAGVERIYGVVGDSLNSVVDAVRRTDGIEWVHVRNEEAAAFAAAAEAQLTGKLAVCAGSCGPGNTHLIQGLYDAHRSGAPVLALASHIPTHQIGTGFFQETHPERLFTECSDYCEMISTPGQMPRVLRIAMQRALGNSAVSVLVIPGDVAHDEATHPTGSSDLVTERGRVVAPDTQVRALAEKVNAARKVMLFCGAGVRDAHAEVMALAEKAAAPIGHTLRGKEWIQFDNPCAHSVLRPGHGAARRVAHHVRAIRPPTASVWAIRPCAPPTPRRRPARTVCSLRAPTPESGKASHAVLRRPRWRRTARCPVPVVPPPPGGRT